MERKYAWHNYDDATMEKVYALSDTYRQFLDNGKTERECVVQAVEFAEAKGYVNLKDIIQNNTPLRRGIRFITLIWINLLLSLISVQMISN